MWKIDHIEAENFISHKELVYEPVNNSLTMVYGVNLDKSTKKSNASGKSVLLDIISFAITGDVLRKVKTLKEVINNDSDSCYAKIWLSNEFLKKTLCIKRSLFVKSSQKIEIDLNGVEQKQLKDLHPKESDKFIEETLGIPFEDIMNYYLISKFKYQSLFLATDSVKKEVINRFSKANLIDNVFPLIKKDKDLDDKRLNYVQLELKEIQTTINVYEEQITDLIEADSEDEKHKRTKEFEDYIEVIRSKINQLKDNIESLEKQIIKIESNIKLKNDDKIAFEKQISKHNDSKLLDLNNQLDLKREEYPKIRDKFKNGFDLLDAEEKESIRLIKEYEVEIKEYHKFILELEGFIAGEIECPKCHHKFILADKEFNLEEAKKQVIEFNGYQVEAYEKLKEIKSWKDNKIQGDRKDLESQVSQAQQASIFDANEIKKQIDSIEKEKQQILNGINAIEREISVFEHDIQKTKLNIVSFNHQIEIYNNDIKKYVQKIIEAKEDKNKDAIKGLNDKVEKLQESYNLKTHELDTLEFNVAKFNEWEAKFKKFKSFLANQSISQIQGQANYFLDKMKADMFVFIDGFRELSNGKLKEEITIELSRDGLESESFGKFSGGEKSLADLASILAMQNIINLTSSTGGLNFLGIDEILESVDEEGMNDIVNCLNNLNQTIILIAHSQPNANIDCNKLIIQKYNKISEII